MKQPKIAWKESSDIYSPYEIVNTLHVFYCVPQDTIVITDNFLLLIKMKAYEFMGVL